MNSENKEIQRFLVTLATLPEPASGSTSPLGPLKPLSIDLP